MHALPSALVPAWSPTLNACCWCDEGDGGGNFLLPPLWRGRVLYRSGVTSAMGPTALTRYPLSSFARGGGRGRRPSASVCTFERKGLQEGARDEKKATWMLRAFLSSCLGWGSESL
ncbi:uncharacterized protein SCHCODRAFT_02693684 [Schizophyllum commune H4-8]|uniref:uncharacterized protein n=1 Tax=Schizophyllum commune (strain H4-8 / FGSC 9210) TaxID=578458 RepID=UPI00215FC171|nr:uncharacterized protein SCHCODRAFT_02693684 [Schizophyllum commune H4-8]KAI5886191.1 hypothetical protein SCHCODRAFT_02693684 [Schizophyllum commune H4-8]